MGASFRGRVSAADRLDMAKDGKPVWRLVLVGDNPVESCEAFIAMDGEPDDMARVAITFGGESLLDYADRLDESAGWLEPDEDGYVVVNVQALHDVADTIRMALMV